MVAGVPSTGVVFPEGLCLRRRLRNGFRLAGMLNCELFGPATTLLDKGMRDSLMESKSFALIIKE